MSDATTPTVPPVAIPYVREQQYVVTCSQCHVEARGAVHELTEGGWTPRDAAIFGKDGPPLWFCPACTLGLRRA